MEYMCTILMNIYSSLLTAEYVATKVVALVDDETALALQFLFVSIGGSI